MRLGLITLAVLVSKCSMAPTVPSSGNLWPLTTMTKLYIETSTLSPSDSSPSQPSVTPSLISPSSSSFSGHQVVKSVGDSSDAWLPSSSAHAVNIPSEHSSQTETSVGAIVTKPKPEIKESLKNNIAPSFPSLPASVVSSHLGSHETSLFHLGPLKKPTNVSSSTGSAGDSLRFRSVWGDTNRKPDTFLVQPIAIPLDEYIQFPIPVTVDLFPAEQHVVEEKLIP